MGWAVWLIRKNLSVTLIRLSSGRLLLSGAALCLTLYIYNTSLNSFCQAVPTPHDRLRELFAIFGQRLRWISPFGGGRFPSNGL